jgi:hypothetical protein
LSRYCNEINDLARTSHNSKMQNLLWMNDLALAVNVNPQQQDEC